MDTSGLIVVALTRGAQRHLSRQFQLRTVHKRYEALLEGLLDQDSGVIELPFRLDVENRPYQIYDEVHGKKGITHWTRLASEPPYTRIAFKPVTGRTHQLRVHAAHPKGLGIPIVGDPLYGNGTGPGQLKLHATDLSFLHPATEEPMSFHSDAPF
jgi:tRNA pseudouridine32 synthase/23S rRNA pseudouridine746 synthase